MRSKTSRPPQNSFSLWKAELACSEQRVQVIAVELAQALRPGDRVLLEGPMGAGKSTFARHILHGLELNQPAEGSPTFALAHEYESRLGPVIHIDFYRMKQESEIEEAGISEYFWARKAIVLSEWTSLFPAFETSVIETAGPQCRVWVVNLGIVSEAERSVEINVGSRSTP